jgi:Protein of unknown function (DUF5132)
LSHEQEVQTADGGNSQKKEMGGSKTPGAKSAYFWGAASGLALALFAPMLRPTARTVVKGGIKMGRYAKKVGTNLKEEFEDIAAEAQADLEAENSTAKPRAKNTKHE